MQLGVGEGVAGLIPSEEEGEGRQECDDGREGECGRMGDDAPLRHARESLKFVRPGMFAKTLRAKLNRTKGLLERSSHRGEINRSQKGRAAAVRFTAAAHRQRAKREENKERERERAPSGWTRTAPLQKEDERGLRPGKKEAE